MTAVTLFMLPVSCKDGFPNISCNCREEAIAQFKHLHARTTIPYQTFTAKHQLSSNDPITRTVVASFAAIPLRPNGVL